jgi:hypothetical protein
MSYRPRSLRQEYELYVEREIEEYKESVPRSVLLSIGDEAVASLAKEQQLALTELVLCDEVDRIIQARLRIPTYSTWRRRRLRALREFSNPERWGLRSDGTFVRAMEHTEGHVLVASTDEGRALYLAANGCAVTALDNTGDIVERVVDAAVQVGITSRVRGLVADLSTWAPDIPLNAVVCAAAVLAELTQDERVRAIEMLKLATTPGGLHLVDVGASGHPLVSIEELRASYGGWEVSIERDVTSSETFLARKLVA